MGKRIRALIACLFVAALAMPTLAYAATLYVQESTDPHIKAHTVKRGTGISYPDSSVEVASGDEVLLDCYMYDGYLFGSWQVEADGSPIAVPGLREVTLAMPSSHTTVNATSGAVIGNQGARLDGSVLTWDEIDGYTSRVAIMMVGTKALVDNPAVQDVDPHDIESTRCRAVSEFAEADASGKHSVDIAKLLRTQENALLKISEEGSYDEQVRARRALQALNGEHEIAICFGTPDSSTTMDREQGRKTLDFTYSYETGGTRLAAPSKLSWDDGFEARWSASANACGYEVTFYEAFGGDESVYGSVEVIDGATTTCSLADVAGVKPAEGATYSFTVKALYDDADYLPSETSVRSAQSGPWAYPAPEAPVISVQPQDASYGLDAAADALTVKASIADGGTLSYQWYRNTDDGTVGGVPIDGATGASYTPSTDAAGTFWYYCVVTNANNGKATSIATDVARIEVTRPVDPDDPGTGPTDPGQTDPGSGSGDSAADPSGPGANPADTAAGPSSGSTASASAGADARAGASDTLPSTGDPMHVVTSLAIGCFAIGSLLVAAGKRGPFKLQ